MLPCKGIYGFVKVTISKAIRLAMRIHRVSSTIASSPCEYFLWEYLKTNVSIHRIFIDNVFIEKYRTLAELSAAIIRAVCVIPASILQRCNLSIRLEECRNKNGYHLEDILRK